MIKNQAEEENFAPIMSIKQASSSHTPVNRNVWPNVLRLPIGCTVHFLGVWPVSDPGPYMQCSICIGLLRSFVWNML